MRRGSGSRIQPEERGGLYKEFSGVYAIYINSDLRRIRLGGAACTSGEVYIVVQAGLTGALQECKESRPLRRSGPATDYNYEPVMRVLARKLEIVVTVASHQEALLIMSKLEHGLVGGS